MYKRLLSLFFVLFLLFSAFFTPTGVSADCSPYEVYSVDSVFKVDGWLLVVVDQDSWTCEMIAGEWTPVLVDVPDKYYILTDGSEAILLGCTCIGQGIFVGFVNGTLYVLTVNKTHVPYQNITITIEGEPHNFTLLKNVTVKTLYRFNGTCLDNISACKIISYPNGTKTNTCRGLIWNSSEFKLPKKSLKGVPVRVQNGTVEIFGRDYTLILPEGINASTLKLEAFEVKHSMVLINTGVIRVPAGMSIDEIPLIFKKVKNGTVCPLGLLNMKKLICVGSGTNTTQSTPGNSGRGKLLNITFIVLLAVVALAVERTLRRR